MPWKGPMVCRPGFGICLLAWRQWLRKISQRPLLPPHSGLYEFNGLPFGPTNGPGTFQRLMEQVLKGLQWKSLVLYLDDIVVFSKLTYEEHVDRVD